MTMTHTKLSASLKLGHDRQTDREGDEHKTRGQNLGC